jgi:rhodanese-related sulfurtransferase
LIITAAMPQERHNNTGGILQEHPIPPPPSNLLEHLDPLVPPPGSKSINDILETARSSLTRLPPQTAFQLLSPPHSPPGVLVDIRPFHQREAEGTIAGALIIERNVLEWRFDPRCDARLPLANRYDLRVIIFCSEGYTSSLAAKALQELGLWNATDIIGGYKAWKKEGLGGVPTSGD